MENMIDKKSELDDKSIEDFEDEFNSIVDTDKFKEIDKTIRISGFLVPESMFGKLSKYLRFSHPKRDTNESSVPDYDYFMKFFENYKNRNFRIAYTENGYMDLGNTLYLKQHKRFASATGCFTEGYFLFADGIIAISKFPLFYKSNSSVSNEDCIYCPIIGMGIAKAIGVDTSENTLAQTEDGKLRILSKNFLRPEEELVTFLTSKEHKQKISDVLVQLDRELSFRKFSPDQISEVRFDFLKQEFLATLIGLKDQKADNIGIITSMDNDGRHVRLAPMFDYDYSFHISKDIDLPLFVCDNDDKKADIGSLIRQYKDYPGFLDFVKRAVSSLNMRQVYRSIYEDTRIRIFENPEGNESLEKFTNFVNSNLRNAREVLHDLEQNERGEK